MKESRRSFWFFCCAGAVGGVASAVVAHWLHAESFPAMLAVAVPTQLAVFALGECVRAFILRKKFLRGTR